jgi:hypothetical protein
MKAFLITMLTVGAAISLARAIDNDGTLHFIHLVVGDAE